MLTPYDDYPIHQTPVPIAQTVSSDPNHYDRYFFNGYGRDGSFFFAAAMGHYPNRGVIDGAVSVVHDGVQHSVFASGRMPSDRSTRVGPLEIDVVEPLRTLRYVLSDNDHGMTADVTFHARTEVVEEPRQQLVRDGRSAMDYTRLTQWGSWEGTITLPTGATIELDRSHTFATRDRSWGVRPIGEQAPTNFPAQPPQLFWLWAPLNFDDSCAHLALFERPDGDRWVEQALLLPLLGDGAEPQHLGRSEVTLDWMPGTREIATATIVPTRKDGTALPAIELERRLTFRMRGVGYTHPEFGHGSNHGELEVVGESTAVDDFEPTDRSSVHVQTLCDVRMGDKRGQGVLEQLAFGPHEPSGLTGILDGYQPT